MMSLVGFEGWQADVEVDRQDAYYYDRDGREDPMRARSSSQ